MTTWLGVGRIRWVGILSVAVMLLVHGIAIPMKRAEDVHKLANMGGTTKTVCVGRFLIDLPADAM